MNYSFIGTGNMAKSIITGIIKNNKDLSKNIYLYDKNNEKSKAIAKEFNLNICTSCQEAIEISDYVFLAVKPHVISSVVSDIKETVRRTNPVIVSIAAGKTIDFIQKCFVYKTNIIRVMPNVNALVSESMTAICPNENISEEQLKEILNIFNYIGKTIIIKENMFPAFTAISGSSPAYAYLFIDTLARAGVRAGFDKKTALEISAQAVLGSAKTILESNQHPWELIDTVCSPGGTTIEAIVSLLKNNFEYSIIQAVECVLNKDNLL